MKKRHLMALAGASLLTASLIAATLTSAVAQDLSGDAIVGTWLADVAETENGTPPFQSMITFNAGGTITEVSNELGLGLQGPAHGSWAETDEGYVATMNTWVFNADTGAVEGRVQIRMTIEMDDPDHMAALTAVDFIDPTGEMSPDIDAGPFEATRLETVGA